MRASTCARSCVCMRAHAGLCVRVCVCACVRACVRLCVCASVHTAGASVACRARASAQIRAPMYQQACPCTFARARVRGPAGEWLCVRACVHVPTYACMRACMRVRKCTCVHVYVCERVRALRACRAGSRDEVLCTCCSTPEREPGCPSRGRRAPGSDRVAAAAAAAARLRSHAVAGWGGLSQQRRRAVLVRCIRQAIHRHAMHRTP